MGEVGMIGVTGRRSQIIQDLEQILPGETIDRISLHQPVILTQCDRFVLAAGYLRSKPASEQTPSEILVGFWLNIAAHIGICETTLNLIPNARICLIGSESGFKGSHDMAYASAKAALHAYVETRKVGAEQQLVAVAPHIISDAGMTLRRPDYAETIERGKDSPRGRWITSREVAETIKWLLWSDAGFWVNNTVVRLSGGV